MKKIFLINLLACAVLFIAFVCAQHANSTCNIKCSSCKQNTKPAEEKVIGGSETEDEIFQFNRIYIKM